MKRKELQVWLKVANREPEDEDMPNLAKESIGNKFEAMVREANNVEAVPSPASDPSCTTVEDVACAPSSSPFGSGVALNNRNMKMFIDRMNATMESIDGEWPSIEDLRKVFEDTERDGLFELSPFGDMEVNDIQGIVK